MPDLLLSEKDRNAQTLAEWLARPEAMNFRHEQHLAFREAS
jgi:hypothetical protein